MIETLHWEVSGDDADQSGNESYLSSELQRKVLLTLVLSQQLGTTSHVQTWRTCSCQFCTCKKFWKKVWASCNITKGCLWLEAQLKQIGDSHQAVWESEYEVIRTEQEFTLKENCHSFDSKQDDRQDWPTTLDQRSHFTLKIHPCKLEARVQGRRKTLVQSLKQFHACFYQLCEKGITLCYGQPARITFG